VNGFLRDADAFFAELFQDVGLGQGLRPFELQIAKDRQLFDLENDIDAAANTFLGKHLRLGLVEKVQEKKFFEVPFESGRVVNVAGTCLDVVKKVLVTKTAVTLDIDSLDDLLSLSRRLRIRGIFARTGSCCEPCARKY